MKFRFDDQPHQSAAVAAVVDLFEGAVVPPTSTRAGQAPGAAGNAGFGLEAAILAENLVAVTEREAVAAQSDLALLEETDLQDIDRSFPNFSVEMETGTGKTYVYISTALRVAEQYGLRKFVIVVHSVAIRAGVVKTFEQTEDHFRAKYPSVRFKWGVLGDSTALGNFVEPSGTVQFLIASVQALDKPDTNTLYASKEEPQLWGDPQSGAGQIASMRPVVIIDEPQNMATDLRRRAIATLNPFFALRYSATHRELFNLVHRLGPKQASEAGLVKRVSVKGIVAGGDGTAYVRVNRLRSKSRVLMAEVTIDRASANGEAARADVVLQNGSDLFEDSNEIPSYRGFVVDRFERKPDRVVFENGVTVQVGQEHGVDHLAVWRDQLRHTIRQHLARQDQIDSGQHGVKVLSLFFVEHVADYVGDEATLPDMFDALFRDEWLRAGKPEADMPDPAELRVAYFPSTKTGILKDTSNRATDTEFEARAYQEIIANKELILDRANPRAFIFSHSALKEGWDNPNVFQVGFLRSSKSDLERRQQIGRGLRLPVDQDGRRVTDPAINRLTLVVDESFAEFRDGLNAEYQSAGDADSGGGAPDIQNADHTVIVRLRDDHFISPEFTELWKRIRYRARYRVTVDSDTLRRRISRSSHLEDLAFLKRRANVVQSADLRYDDDGQVTTEDSAVAQAAGERIVVVGQTLPDVIRLIEDQLQYGKFPLQLTRRTIAAMISEMPDAHKRRVLDDPERWARIVANAIRIETIEHMVSEIAYEPTDEESWWDANIVFVKEDPKTPPQPLPGNPDPRSGVAEAPDPGLNLFDHVEYDSHVERNFAAKLENDGDHIKLFTKLPRRFKVATPVGEYLPDWAIVYELGGSERLYLVRETKDTLNLKDLGWEEALKIRFAERHFAAAPVGPVDYNHTTDHADLRIELAVADGEDGA